MKKNGKTVNLPSYKELKGDALTGCHVMVAHNTLE
jgi:hypothetical protein